MDTFIQSLSQLCKYLLGYRENYSKFNKQHFAAFKTHYSSHYSCLKDVAKTDLIVDNLLVNTFAFFLKLENYILNNARFRFNSENCFIFDFLNDLINPELIFSTSKSKFENEETNILKTILQSIDSVRKRPDLNTVTDHEFILEHLKIFQKEFENKFNEINNKIELNRNNSPSLTVPDRSSTSQPRVEPDNFSHSKTAISRLFNKLARYKNHIQMFKTHLNNKTSPPSLFFNRFPTPFLHDDETFVNNYNALIEDFQVKTMNLCVSTLESRINSLEVKLIDFKTKFSEDENIDNKFNELELSVNKQLEPQLKIKSEQTTRCKVIPFKVKVTEKSASTPFNQPTSTSVRATSSHSSLPSSSNRNNSHHNRNDNRNRNFSSNQPKRVNFSNSSNPPHIPPLMSVNTATSQNNFQQPRNNFYTAHKNQNFRNRRVYQNQR